LRLRDTSAELVSPTIYSHIHKAVETVKFYLYSLQLKQYHALYWSMNVRSW
jgi:hypothetical protein